MHWWLSNLLPGRNLVLLVELVVKAIASLTAPLIQLLLFLLVPDVVGLAHVRQILQPVITTP